MLEPTINGIQIGVNETKSLTLKFKTYIRVTRCNKIIKKLGKYWKFSEIWIYDPMKKNGDLIKINLNHCQKAKAFNFFVLPFTK